MDLTTLPEDALLEVLSYLDTRQLLRCRGVCRRLRDAALHPQLWWMRVLHLKEGSVQLAGAALRLAPCLGELLLDLDAHLASYTKLGHLLATTNCAVLALRVYLSSTGALLVSSALSRQAALGRLDFVFIRAWDVNRSELRLLLEQLLFTPGLTGVEVEADHLFEDRPKLSLVKAAEGQSVPASLERLVYEAQDGTLPCYLQWHADTLQVVHLPGPMRPPAGTAALLAALPNLRELQCSILDGMPALLRCPALESLSLRVNVDKTTRPHLRGVREFLRQAAADRLETLTLDYDQDETCDDANDLLLSLHPEKGHRGTPSPLRSLTLEYGEFARRPQPQLGRLVTVLPRLENLVSLKLGGPPSPELLQALDGRVVPRLERLRVCLVMFRLVKSDWGGGCPHQWAHGSEPRALLRRYPRLHIEVGALHRDGCDECEDDEGCELCECRFCSKNRCHDFEFNFHTLFSHRKREVCSRKHSGVGIRVRL